MSGLPALLVGLCAWAGAATDVDRTWHDEARTRIEWEIPLREGKPHGLVQQFRADGSVEVACDYRDGERHGVQRSFDSSGTIVIREIPYVDGLAEGIEIRRFPNGRVQDEIPWRAGQRHGLQKTYTRSGVLVWEREWQEGILLKSRSWDEHGKPISETDHSAAAKNGEESP